MYSTYVKVVQSLNEGRRNDCYFCLVQEVYNPKREGKIQREREYSVYEDRYQGNMETDEQSSQITLKQHRRLIQNIYSVEKWCCSQRLSQCIGIGTTKL